MVQLACVFFHVDAGDADAFFLAFHFDVDMAAEADRFIELRDLVVFGQIGVKIVFTVEFVEFLDLAAQRQAGADSELDHLFVEHGQCAGHTQADRANMGVRLAAEFGRAGAERFRVSFKLGMDLQADNCSIFFHYLLPPNVANTLWYSLACSKV